MKAEMLLQKMHQFFTPSPVFYAPFLLSILVICMLKFDFQWVFYVKKGGKKLVRGVKNFCISKYEYSAFFCTKNHYHIVKTRENRCKWNSTILKYRWDSTLILKISTSIFYLSLEWLNFICIYFHKFLKYGNDFWCK